MFLTTGWLTHQYLLCAFPSLSLSLAGASLEPCANAMSNLGESDSQKGTKHWVSLSPPYI